jgi:periplasmic protein TonB
MRPHEHVEVYSPREIARAAGSTEAHVRALTGNVDGLLTHADAVRIGRLLVAHRRAASAPVYAPLFSLFSLSASDGRRPVSRRLPLAMSGALHAGLLAALIGVLSLAPTAATTVETKMSPPEAMRLVFLATPGPGGGGGGGGQRQPLPPPKAEREGHRSISSPLPRRDSPKPLRPVEEPPRPKPAVLAAEPLPALVAPIVVASADLQSRSGVLEQVAGKEESRGSGRGDGVGSGRGTGIGEGDGPGVGPGSGGGIGGGPYRPGSGIEPPRLVREVKADYTEEARQRGLGGEVVLEIVVRRDGTVGTVKVLKGLGSGLNDRAIQAVSQWRFLPAQRLGTPVDVIVEVGVEFKLR